MNKTILYIIVLLAGTVIFMLGYHAIDLNYNFQNQYMQDKTLSGKIIDKDFLYFNGIRSIFIGVILMLISSYNIARQLR